MFLFILACTKAPSKDSANRSQDSAELIVDTADALVDTATSDVVVEPSACPDNMVLINEKFCIDRYEASVRAATYAYLRDSNDLIRKTSKSIDQIIMSSRIQFYGCRRGVPDRWGLHVLQIEW